MELREIESALVNAIGEFNGQLPPEQLDDPYCGGAVAAPAGQLSPSQTVARSQET
jgi:hypothetical protein